MSKKLIKWLLFLIEFLELDVVLNKECIVDYISNDVVFES